MRYARTTAPPSAVSASPAASAAASSGTLGCPISAKFVSSKSCACPAVPLASAAHPGEVTSRVPTTVARGVPLSARATARTARAAGSPAPASITPSVSSAARRNRASASGGQSSREVLTANSATRAVALMGGKYHECRGGGGGEGPVPRVGRRLRRRRAVPDVHPRGGGRGAGAPGLRRLLARRDAPLRRGPAGERPPRRLAPARGPLRARSL